MLLPFALRLRLCCAFFSFLSARRGKRGLSVFELSEWIAKWVKPRPMPTTASVSGSGSVPVSTTSVAKYLPAASLTTVTADGVEGRVRDHLNGTSPTLGRGSLSPALIFRPALAVKRIDCRLSLRLLNRGLPMRGRLPLSPSKNLGLRHEVPAQGHGERHADAM
ncbi:hypothetical protein ACWF95_36730 [Streptomyces vinaceus]